MFNRVLITFSTNLLFDVFSLVFVPPTYCSTYFLRVSSIRHLCSSALHFFEATRYLFYPDLVHSTELIMDVCIKSLDPSEEFIADRFYDVFNPIICFSTITEAQGQLMSIPVGQSEFFDKLKLSLVWFTQEPLPNCPKLVHLVSRHYSINEKVIMNSSHDHILCKSDPTTLRQALNFQEDLVPSLVSFIEANVLQVFEQATSEVKDNLYKHILTTPVSHEVLAIPFQSDLCIPIICSSGTILSQILGSDDDSQITQVMLGFFIYLSQSGTKAINFDEFLVE